MRGIAISAVTSSPMTAYATSVKEGECPNDSETMVYVRYAAFASAAEVLWLRQAATCEEEASMDENRVGRCQRLRSPCVLVAGATKTREFTVYEFRFEQPNNWVCMSCSKRWNQ